jgi:hypothetical protein
MASRISYPKDLASLDWLVRKYSIGILPSVASLKVLRSGKSVTAAAKPMIGFRDPIFDRAAQTNATQCGGSEPKLDHIL